jgi:hypothetical protein
MEALVLEEVEVVARDGSNDRFRAKLAKCGACGGIAWVMFRVGTQPHWHFQCATPSCEITYCEDPKACSGHAGRN